jgi:hypothetical protein
MAPARLCLALCLCLCCAWALHLHGSGHLHELYYLNHTCSALRHFPVSLSLQPTPTSLRSQSSSTATLHILFGYVTADQAAHALDTITFQPDHRHQLQTYCLKEGHQYFFSPHNAIPGHVLTICNQALIQLSTNGNNQNEIVLVQQQDPTSTTSTNNNCIGSMNRNSKLKQEISRSTKHLIDSIGTQETPSVQPTSRPTMCTDEPTSRPTSIPTIFVRKCERQHVIRGL